MPIWTAARAPRRPWRRSPAEVLRAVSLSEPARSRRRVCAAAAQPKTSVVTTERTAAKASIRGSTPSGDMAGRFAVPWAAIPGRLPRRAEAEGSAQEREHEALGQELASQPRLARADRGAHRDFPLASFRAGEEQIRDVGARHQQEEEDGAEHETERAPRGAADVLLHGFGEGREEHFGGIDALAREVGGEHPQLGGRAARRGAPAEEPRGVVTVVAVRQLLRIELHRDPDLRGLGGFDLEIGRQREPLRHDADDAAGDRVELDGCAEDRRGAAETALPGAVCEDGDGRTAGTSSSSVNPRPSRGRDPSVRTCWR